MFLPGQWASPSGWSRNTWAPTRCSSLTLQVSDSSDIMMPAWLRSYSQRDVAMYNMQEKLCPGICLDCAQRSRTKKEVCILESHSVTSALIDTFMFDGWGWKEEHVFLIQWCSYHNVSLANIFSCIINEAVDLMWNLCPMWIWSLIGECAG